MTWNENAGTKRESSLPPFWPPQNAPVGSGVCGEVIEYSKGSINGDPVENLLLANCVMREAVEGGRFRLVRVGDVTVTLNRALRTAIPEHRTPQGTVIQLSFTGINPKLNNMREYEVREVEPKYLLSLHEKSVRIER